MHFKLQGNVNPFWAPNNSGATAHVDLEYPRAILIPVIFGEYVMEKPRTGHALFAFTIVLSGKIVGAQPRFLLHDIKLILKWCVMAGQADDQ